VQQHILPTCPLAAADVVLPSCPCVNPALAHPHPLQFLQDALPRLSPPTLAGLLACHTSLGLGNTTKLLRRTATEYQRRPEASPSVDMLLGIMAGLVAGGKDYIRDLPVQLLTRWGSCADHICRSCSQQSHVMHAYLNIACIHSSHQYHAMHA
jgi:hypothetical protein